MNTQPRTSKPEFYFHFTENRLTAAIGEGLIYDKPELSKAATVFIRMEDDGDWRASVARCSWGDQFSRKTGRNVARRRYFKDREATAKFDHKPTYEEALALV